MAPNVSTSHLRLYTLEIPAGNDISWAGRGGRKTFTRDKNIVRKNDRQGLFTKEKNEIFPFLKKVTFQGRMNTSYMEWYVTAPL
jgi:hypothetical protein